MNYEEKIWHDIFWEVEPTTTWYFELKSMENFTPYHTDTKNEKMFSKWRWTWNYKIERKERIYENVIKALKMLTKLKYELYDKIENVDKRPRDTWHNTEIKTKKWELLFSFVWNDEYDLQKNLYTFLGKLVIENENVIPFLFDKK